jgi:hypothetical protein
MDMPDLRAITSLRLEGSPPTRIGPDAIGGIGPLAFCDCWRIDRHNPDLSWGQWMAAADFEQSHHNRTAWTIRFREWRSVRLGCAEYAEAFKPGGSLRRDGNNGLHRRNAHRDNKF